MKCAETNDKQFSDFCDLYFLIQSILYSKISESSLSILTKIKSQIGRKIVSQKMSTLREIHVRDDDIRPNGKYFPIDNKRILLITLKEIITSERSERAPC